MPTVDQETIETLKLFAEKTGRLGELSLADEVMKKLSGTVRWTDGEGWSDEYLGPQGEPIDAFVLTLRLLIQNNEPISLKRMSQLYQGLPLDPSFARRFEEQRSQLNGFLDGETGLSIEESRQLTYRDIFYIFLYGSLAHTNNPEKRRIFCELREGPWFGLFQFHFAECLRAFVIALHFLGTVNGEVLAQVGEAA